MRSLFFSCLFALTSFPSLAQTTVQIGTQTPSCSPTQQGAERCINGRLCSCAYHYGGTMSRVPAGWQWSCSTISTRCLSTETDPATLNPYQGQYPTHIEIDRSNQTTTIHNDNSSTNSNSSENTN